MCVDELTLTRTAHGPVAGLFVLQFDGVSFPSADWRDFPIVVLGWWAAALSPAEPPGGEVEVPFMDGPYYVGVESFHDRIRLACVERRATLEVRGSYELERSVVVGEVCRVGRRLLNACRERGWFSDDEASLDHLLGELTNE